MRNLTLNEIENSLALLPQSLLRAINVCVGCHEDAENASGSSSRIAFLTTKSNRHPLTLVTKTKLKMKNDARDAAMRADANCENEIDELRLPLR